MTWADRVAELAIATIRDPASSPEDRAKARAALTGDTGLDVSRLSAAERRACGQLLAKALGRDAACAVLATDTSSRRARAQAEAFDAMKAAERAIARCDAAWREDGGPGWLPPGPWARTIEQHLAAIFEADPDGTKLRALIG